MRHAKLVKILLPTFLMIQWVSFTAFSADLKSSAPVTPVQMVTDEYFGVKVDDPYRWLENLTDPKVLAWFHAQNDYTQSILARIPGRATLLARIKTLDDSVPAYVTNVWRLPDERYFYQKRLASEDLSKLYTRIGLRGQEKLLFDPTQFAKKNGPHYAISYFTPSDDGRYVAVGVSPAGSENAVIHVIDVQSGRETADVIDRAQFGEVDWLPDNRSFFYNRLQKLGPKNSPEDQYLNSSAYLHVIGTTPENDKRIFGFGMQSVTIVPTDLPFVSHIPGTAYMIGIVTHGVKNESTAYVAPINSLNTPHIPWKLIFDINDEVVGVEGHGDDLYLLSHKDASRFKVLRTSLSKPDVAHAEVIIPPSEAVIRDIVVASDALYVKKQAGSIGQLVRVPYGKKQVETVTLPFQGTVDIAAADYRLPGVLLSLETWTKAYKIYAYNPQSQQVSDTHLQPAGPFDAPTDLTSIEVKVKSYDGTEIPLSIVYKKGTKLDGSHPTLLLGYGAYGISLDPGFSPASLAWYEQGGISAIAHVRGGGEYGEDWHLAGKMLTKPNTWKDFIACAKYLIDHRYTTTARLAVKGGSAGGITVGRAITERPDLFAVAIDNVPASDMIRAEFTPSGQLNTLEFGSVTTKAGFDGLYEMSAYHHVKNGVAYPAMMLTTGFNDPRVSAWEPGKMAARLQAATSSKKPILLRVDFDAGHGIGSTKTQQQEKMADELSFILWQFGVRGF